MANQLPENYISDSTIQSLTTASDNAAAAASAAGVEDYKALVCIFLFGAVDSHNMVVPYGESNTNRSKYETARALGVRLEESELTNTLLGTNPEEWALHPQLPNFFTEWNNNKLAIVRDVGVLNRPTTKELYQTNPNDLYRPDRLFAHNIQQLAWQTALPFREPKSTGWFGRTTNLIDEVFNPDSRIGSSCISVSGANPQTFAYSPKVSVMFPATTIPEGNNRGLNNDTFTTGRDDFYHKNSPPSSPVGYPRFPRNVMYNAFNQVFNNSVDSQKDVNTNGQGWNANDNGIGKQLEDIFSNAYDDILSTKVNVPDPTQADPFAAENLIERSLPNSYFLSTVKNIAKIIYSRGDVGGIGFDQKRQMIFSGVGGWDNHNNLRYYHDALLRSLDICIKALRDAIELMGLGDNVTIFTETDFGRTFRSNGTYGADHAWSGHSFVIGGAVKGGMYGPEPDYELGGPLDVSNLGRFIPNYSIEQYYGTLLKWFDIPEEQISLVLPAIDLFTPTDIGFMN